MAGKIFINYRRGDDAGFTQALYLRLEDEFATNDLFMDVEGHIKPGDDFAEVLNAQVAAADVLLVVIGPRWADLLAARQGDPDDFVAIEIKAALGQGKRVIPVLVGGAGMPHGDTLPEAIRPLARRNAVGLRPERFKADCQGLITALRESIAAAVKERAARTEAERMAAEALRRETEANAAARAQAAEERSRAQAEAGLSSAEIRKAQELANWEFVKDRNDAQDLRDHLARFPNGSTERYALSKLDNVVWAGLGSAPTAEQLRSYLDEFSKGVHAASARASVEVLERVANEAKVAEQQRAQETAEWGVVAASSDESEIQSFLERWPNGPHSASAKTRIAELKRLNTKPLSPGMAIVLMVSFFALSFTVYWVWGALLERILGRDFGLSQITSILPTGLVNLAEGLTYSVAIVVLCAPPLGLGAFVTLKFWDYLDSRNRS